MVTNDASMNSFKHKIMEEVCRLEWNGENNQEHIEQLVLKMIPGPKPEYRCCFYCGQSRKRLLHGGNGFRVSGI